MVAVALVHPAPRQGGEQDRAGRPDVRARVDLAALPLRLLRGHVRRRPEHEAFDRERRLGVALGETGAPEVGEHDPAVRREEHVGRLQVAMEDACRVDRDQRVEEAVERGEGVVERELASGRRASVLERVACEELHHEEDGAVLRLSVVEDAFDARVIDSIGEMRFLEKALDDRRIGRLRPVEDLQRGLDAVAMRRLVGRCHRADRNERIEPPLPIDGRPHPSVGVVVVFAGRRAHGGGG